VVIVPLRRREDLRLSAFISIKPSRFLHQLTAIASPSRPEDGGADLLILPRALRRCPHRRFSQGMNRQIWLLSQISSEAAYRSLGVQKQNRRVISWRWELGRYGSIADIDFYSFW